MCDFHIFIDIFDDISPFRPFFCEFFFVWCVGGVWWGGRTSSKSICTHMCAHLNNKIIKKKIKKIKINKKNGNIFYKFSKNVANVAKWKLKSTSILHPKFSYLSIILVYCNFDSTKGVF